MNKLKHCLESCEKLNDWFDNLGCKGNQDLDIIATYLAVQIHAGTMDVEDVIHLSKLVIQVSKSLEKISSGEWDE